MLNENGSVSVTSVTKALRTFLASGEQLLELLQRVPDERAEPVSALISMSSNLDRAVADATKFTTPATGFAICPGNSPNTTRVYIAGCAGLKALSAQLQIPLFKIGTCSSNLTRRLTDLNVDRYAASHRLRKKVISDPGFDDWRFMTFDYDIPRVDDSPIWIESRALRINLPSGLTPEHFEGHFREALAPISLATWLKSDQGRHHLKTIGIDRALAERYTPYGYGDSVRLSQADELYLFRHRADAPRLFRVIESIVDTHGQREAS